MSGYNIVNLCMDVIKFEQHELTKMQYDARDIMFFKEKKLSSNFIYI